MKKAPMYINQSSIRNKIGPEVGGWTELLHGVGFGFHDQLPEPTIYFPAHDKQDALVNASESLKALLGLPQNSLAAFSKLTHSTDSVFKLLPLVVDD